MGVKVKIVELSDKSKSVDVLSDVKKVIKFIIETDKKNEIKDGIVKAYDPTVPVYIDCMHHVCTILSKFISLKKDRRKTLS